MRSSILDMPSSTAGIALSRYIPLAFVPAGIGLLTQIVTATTPADRLLLLALFVFCPELAYMAQLDLKNLLAVVAQGISPSLDSDTPVANPLVIGSLGVEQSEEGKPLAESTTGRYLEPAKIKLTQAQNTYLARFYIAVISTVVLEIMGLYIAIFSLPWGAAIIISSQVCFNLVANVQLFPGAIPAIVPFGIADRAAVLIANAIGISLLLFWPVESLRLWVALSLLCLITLFLVIKYGTLWAAALAAK